MKYLFTYVFLFFIFGSVLTETTIPRYKLARLGLALRKLKLHKEELRKLQNTAEISDEPVPIPESYNSTGDVEKKEEGNANQEDAVISAKTPVSTQPTKKDNKDAGIQVMKFHNFATKQKNINFGVFFFFINRQIPVIIIIRIRVTYYRRLRSLDGETVDDADSLRTVCRLNATNISNWDAIGGKTVDYTCEATASREIEPESVNITINTDLDMVTVSKNGTMEDVRFSNINFNANTSAEASNLKENILEINENNCAINYLRNGTVDDSDKSVLRIMGTNKNDLGQNITNGEKLTMILQTSNKGIIKPEEYECTMNITNDNTSLTMDCDTSSKSINTSNKYLHLSVSKETYQILTLQMANYDNTDAIIRTASSNGIRYRKNSGGLSGGAIAGIVIACVVVLAAASIAAIMLRRPKSNTDNTTVVGLKTVDNI